MGNYKDKHKTTKIGDFLRSLNLKENLPNILNAGYDIATGDFKGAINSFVTKNTELTPEQREYALKLLESDVAEQQEITKRWESDNKTDSKLTRNIRPVTLAVLTFTLILFIILDQGGHRLVGKKHPFHGIFSFGGIFFQRIDVSFFNDDQLISSLSWWCKTRA